MALRKIAGLQIRVSPETHAKLQELARSGDRSMGEIVTDLVDRFEREEFWKDANESLARLRADPVAWKAYMEETAAWDQLSGDGLENEEPYYTPEEEEEIRAAADRT